MAAEIVNPLIPHTIGSDVDEEEIKRHVLLDERMTKAARNLRILDSASWPYEFQRATYEGFAKGNEFNPVIEYPKQDWTEVRKELEAVDNEADEDTPIGRYLSESARSWGVAAQFLENLGNPDATKYSIALYGGPNEELPGHGPTTREAAQHFINIAEELDQELMSPAETVQISAVALQLQLQRDLDDYFDGRVIDVETDPTMLAKAAAGATRIRLRTNATFTDYDKHQLLQHEAFVHSLTALNGRLQHNLPSLGLSSPRVTATQEGLATFAEQITGSIDIGRMKRLSLRIEAVSQALDGATFVDVYRYFLSMDQTPEESFNSAQRVFRGVQTMGGQAFTKDTVYLRGLVDVHTFFRVALRQQELYLCRWLFAGKMTLEDVRRFEPMFRSGVLQPARWMPTWIQRANGLAGMLAFSLFANRIRLDAISNENAREIEKAESQ